MKKLLVFAVIIFPFFGQSQSVAINADGALPHGSAILDVKSETKGILVPRMSTIQRGTIPGPAIGLIVFDMDTYSYWMYRGDVNGGWVEMTHQLQNQWDVSGFNIFNRNSGNVGIGTNNPADKLTINATNPTISMLNAGSSTGFLQVFGNHLRLGTYNANTTGNLGLQTRSIERMTITPSGNIGIGTTSPVGRFQVFSGDNANLTNHGYFMMGSESGVNTVMDNNELQVRSNGVAATYYLQSEGGSVFIGDPAPFNSAHKLGVNGNTVITGNVRIGNTVSPNGYKLAVDGKAIFTEVLVKLVPGWPDYVFEKGHRLPTILEVEDYINKHKHLPGIPAANEIESAGLNLGQMQKLQMEKIEELTLYIIELKKEIDALKKVKK